MEKPLEKCTVVELRGIAKGKGLNEKVRSAVIAHAFGFPQRFLKFTPLRRGAGASTNATLPPRPPLTRRV
jgi:hypothetical protein